MKLSLVLVAVFACLALSKPVDDDVKEPAEIDQQEQKPIADNQDKAEARSDRGSEESHQVLTQSEYGDVQQFVVSIPELKEQQFKATDKSGRYSFGYAFPEQAHLEARDQDGTVRGTYFFTSPEGKNNQVQYQADKSGFRVAASNLPIFNPVVPVPVQDTPEVQEARKQHIQLWTSIFNQQNPGAAAQSQDRYVAPLDLPSRPVSDAFVDAAKQAVVIEGQEEEPDTFDIEEDPVRLAVQLISSHHANAGQESSRFIPRPKDFYPKDLPEPYNSFDFFRRTHADSVVLTNPEFIDLKRFLLTNRFRTTLDKDDSEPATNDSPSEKKQSVAETKVASDDKTKQQEIEKEAPVTQDDKSAEDKTQVARPVIAQVYVIPQDLYNQYFNLPPDNKPVLLTRDGLDKLPESLKAVAFGLPSIDGPRDAQVAPYQRYSTQYPKFLLKDALSPYFVPYQQGQPYPIYPFQFYSDSY